LAWFVFSQKHYLLITSMNHSTTASNRSVFLNSVLIISSLALAAAFAAIPFVTHAALLTQQLEMGMRNSDVTSLQSFLATDATIYPQGLVTGYYGFLTKSAVSNYQSANGIDPVGRVGPITLASINAKMGGATTWTDTMEGAGKVTRIGVSQPVLSNVTVTKSANSASITWNSNTIATAKVFYSTQWPFNYNTAQSVTSSNAASYNQSVSLTNLQSNTTYYYAVESLDAQGNFSWSVGTSFRTN
jgi:peptidoglycan hydrolase-like protein with peptidoglycan-binding domain